MGANAYTHLVDPIELVRTEPHAATRDTNMITEQDIHDLLGDPTAAAHAVVSKFMGYGNGNFQGVFQGCKLHQHCWSNTA